MLTTDSSDVVNGGGRRDEEISLDHTWIKNAARVELRVHLYHVMCWTETWGFVFETLFAESSYQTANWPTKVDLCAGLKSVDSPFKDVCSAGEQPIGTNKKYGQPAVHPGCPQYIINQIRSLDILFWSASRRWQFRLLFIFHVLICLACFMYMLTCDIIQNWGKP